MKNNYVKCYLNKNLGDDLFIKILCDRYKNELFYVYTNKSINICDNFITLSSNIFVKIVAKFFYLLKLHNYFSFLQNKKFKRIIIIGGSLFIEKNYNELTYYNLLKKNNKKYYIIGANIGPFKNNFFINNTVKPIFKGAQDVCVRDLRSYEYVKDISNVRYAPDIVFSMNFNDYCINKNKRKVIFSVINCEMKKNQLPNGFNPDYYYSLIEDGITYFLKKGYEVLLMSFCKEEGDEIVIENFMNKIDNNNLYKYYYNGNIDEAINYISDCEIIVGSRFHANIIGFSLNKIVIPISYNDKTENMLNDIGFNQNFINLKYLDNKVKFEKFVHNEIFDVSEIKKKANKHFEKLDDIFLRGENK